MNSTEDEDWGWIGPSLWLGAAGAIAVTAFVVGASAYILYSYLCPCQ